MVFHWYFQMHFFFLLEIFLYLLSNKDMILPSFRKYRGSWTRNVSWGDGGFGNSPLSNWCQFSCKHNKFCLYQDINIYQHINHINMVVRITYYLCLHWNLRIQMKLVVHLQYIHCKWHYSSDSFSNLFRMAISTIWKSRTLIYFIFNSINI